MATSSDREQPEARCRAARSSIARPIVPNSPAVTNEPIMNTSPWAKLMSSMIP